MTSMMLHKRQIIPDISVKNIFPLIGKCIEVMRSGKEITGRTNQYKVKNINELNSKKVDIRNACLFIIAVFSDLRIPIVLKLDIDCVKIGINQYRERYYTIEVNTKNRYYQKVKLQLHVHEIVKEAVETILKVFEYDRDDDKALFVRVKNNRKYGNKSKRLAVVNINKAIAGFIERHTDLKGKLGNWNFNIGQFRLIAERLRYDMIIKDYNDLMHTSKVDNICYEKKADL